MTAGYIEFEFDLPDALLRRLVTVFDSLVPAPLVDANVRRIPEEQGVYQLFLNKGGITSLVYIGKTHVSISR